MLYRIFCVSLGGSEGGLFASLRSFLEVRFSEYGLSFLEDVDFREINDGDVLVDERTPSVVVVDFSGASSGLAVNIPKVIPVVPLVSDLNNVSSEVPDSYRHLNCVSLQHGIERISITVLESLGLLPRQRRVFLSYKRDESRVAALQLFEELSARNFDVFLDTHGVALGIDFQEALWDRLCDSDVLLMLDTPSYFQSRWTSSEYGRALAKGISVLRVVWPGIAHSKRTANAISVDLDGQGIDEGGLIVDEKVHEICSKLEEVRSLSHAVRHINAQGDILDAVEGLGGQYFGVGPRNTVFVQLPGGRDLTFVPFIGVPSAREMQQVSLSCGSGAALIYDSIGLSKRTQEHLDWLGEEIKKVRFVKRHRLGWEIGGWGE